LGEREQEGLSQRQLTELMSSDPNTVASLVDRMETNGLVQRRQHETDKRANRLRLRAKGKKTYAAAREIAITLQQEVLSALPAERRDAFLGELAQMAEACRNAAEESLKRD
jgi:MarR family transcriptional regulator, transcriptional regulator for hemolysin